MAENTSNKPARRPARVALVAAALAAALGITASAAEIPAVKEFFATVFVTVKTDGLLDGMQIPVMAVEEREGRTILILDEEEIDVTEAIADDGEYLYEGEGYTVRVDTDGEATLSVDCGEDGKAISIVTRPGMKDEKVNYNVVTDGDDVLKTGLYEVTSSEESGAVNVVDEEGQVFDYHWDGVKLTPTE